MGRGFGFPFEAARDGMLTARRSGEGVGGNPVVPNQFRTGSPRLRCSGEPRRSRNVSDDPPLGVGQLEPIAQAGRKWEASSVEEAVRLGRQSFVGGGVLIIRRGCVTSVETGTRRQGGCAKPGSSSCASGFSRRLGILISSCAAGGLPPLRCGVRWLRRTWAPEPCCRRFQGGLRAPRRWLQRRSGAWRGAAARAQRGPGFEAVGHGQR